jgi:hypothetical protein
MKPRLQYQLRSYYFTHGLEWMIQRKARRKDAAVLNDWPFPLEN